MKTGGWTVFSGRFNEACHPDIGPEAEARRLYVDGLDLRERIAGASPASFTIWDVGMGGAANVLTAIRECADIKGSLNVISFDRTPDQLAFSMDHPDKLEYIRGFEQTIMSFLLEKNARFVSGNLGVEWRFVEGDFTVHIGGASFATTPLPDAIFFDPHSPRRNPEMWTLGVFEQLRASIGDRPCNLATYSRSTHVRVAMLLAGFHVGRGEGSGMKEETTIAATTAGLIMNPLPTSWLKTAERSRSAEPWHGPAPTDQPISTETLLRLRAHPQFDGPAETSWQRT